MQKLIRIGTRESELALWQAKSVQSQLEGLGCKTTLVPIDLIGTKVVLQPRPSSCDWTLLACQRASSLSRVPIRISFCMTKL
jgi:hypothetical protein